MVSFKILSDGGTMVRTKIKLMFFIPMILLLLASVIYGVFYYKISNYERDNGFILSSIFFSILIALILSFGIPLVVVASYLKYEQEKNEIHTK